jgi:hypothetical protein
MTLVTFSRTQSFRSTTAHPTGWQCRVRLAALTHRSGCWTNVFCWKIKLFVSHRTRIYSVRDLGTASYHQKKVVNEAVNDRFSMTQKKVFNDNITAAPADAPRAKISGPKSMVRIGVLLKYNCCKKATPGVTENPQVASPVVLWSKLV